jgi:hypothetical protein
MTVEGRIAKIEATLFYLSMEEMKKTTNLEILYTGKGET